MHEYPVMMSYAAALQQDYIVRLSLDRFGIENFYLTVRFRRGIKARFAEPVRGALSKEPSSTET